MVYANRHPGFRPSDVFRAFYSDACKAAFGDRSLIWNSAVTAAAVTPSMLVRLTENRFVSFFGSLRAQRNLNAADIHLRNLQRFAGHWARVHSVETCFLCLCRRPQSRFACQHMLCQVCVQVCGQNSAADPLTFTVLRCPLCRCRTGVPAIGVRPKSARTRILSVDGGGSRGSVPFEVLRILERRFNVPTVLNRAFDQAIGTSAGS
jgi:hypothetical protein